MDAHIRTLLTVICEAALEKKLVADLEQLGAHAQPDRDCQRAARQRLRDARVGLHGDRQRDIC